MLWICLSFKVVSINTKVLVLLEVLYFIISLVLKMIISVTTENVHQYKLESEVVRRRGRNRIKIKMELLPILT